MDLISTWSDCLGILGSITCHIYELRCFNLSQMNMKLHININGSCDFTLASTFLCKCAFPFNSKMYFFLISKHLKMLHILSSLELSLIWNLRVMLFFSSSRVCLQLFLKIVFYSSKHKSKKTYLTIIKRFFIFCS